jgi:hypothetical protein
MRKLMISAFALVLGCSPGPEAPAIDGGSAQVDSGMAADSGAAPAPGVDAGRPPVRDSGQSATDATRPPSAEVDAGFVRSQPEPPEGDACADICAHTDCQEDCLIYCRLGELATGGDQRREFLGCLQDNPCDHRQCWPEIEVGEACREICDDRSKLERCSIDFLIEAGEDICPQVCTGMLARFEPANAQAWLDCAVNVCREGRHVDCNPEIFMGPTPSQVCLDAGRSAATCPGSHQHYFAEAWECEHYRSPIEQRGLGGNALAECMAQTHSCGDMRLYECLTQAEQASGRSAAIQELCAPLAQCPDDNVFGCRAMAAGMTPMMGNRQVQLMAECIAAAGSDCNALERCVDWNFEEMALSQSCRDACSGCGQGDWGEQCARLCNWTERSMSVDDAARFGECVAQNTCSLPHQLAECGRQILPEVGQICQGFWQQTGRRCPSWRHESSAMVEIFCMLSGVRTGVISGDALNRCGETIGCEMDPMYVCLKGRLGG